MGTIAEKLEYLNDTKTAIKGALQNRGVTISDTDTFRSYADKVAQIGEEVERTKFGASIDTWLGDVDENGTLNSPTWTGALNFAGVKTIGASALQYSFYFCSNITSVDLSSLQSVGEKGLYYAFSSCSNLTNIDLSSLQSVGKEGLYYAFYSCTGLTNADLSSLQSVGEEGLSYAFYSCTGLTNADLSSLQSVPYDSLYYTFGYCSNLTIVDLSSLQSVESNSMRNTFKNCTSLTTISFPALTDVQSNSFGTVTSTYPFQGCYALTEIHFRADMQTTIEAMTGYSSKWGASNATIYFDL